MDHPVAAATSTTGTESLVLGLGFGVPRLPGSLGLGRNIGDPPRPGRIRGRLQRQEEPGQQLQRPFGGMPQAIVADLVKPLRQDVHQEPTQVLLERLGHPLEHTRNPAPESGQNKGDNLFLEERH